MIPARELILNNFWQKVFSLVLATLIWVTVDRAYLKEVQFPTPPLRPSDTKVLRCPITILTSAAARQTFKVDPSEVDVRVSGDRARLNTLKPEEIKVEVSLIDLDASKLADNDLFPVEVNYPKDITGGEVWPTFVRVTPVNDL
jgi:hypothetical protein